MVAIKVDRERERERAHFIILPTPTQAQSWTMKEKLLAQQHSFLSRHIPPDIYCNTCFRGMNYCQICTRVSQTVWALIERKNLLGPTCLSVSLTAHGDKFYSFLSPGWPRPLFFHVRIKDNTRDKKLSFSSILNFGAGAIAAVVCYVENEEEGGLSIFIVLSYREGEREK